MTTIYLEILKKRLGTKLTKIHQETNLITSHLFKDFERFCGAIERISRLRKLVGAGGLTRSVSA